MELPRKDPRDRGPDSKKIQFTVTLPQWMVKQLDAMAAEHGYRRNSAIRELLRWCVDHPPEKPKTK